MKVGIDILEVDRFNNMDADEMKRLFTQGEVFYLRSKNMSPETAAGLFCAKEAFLKALGIGIVPSVFKEIEITHDNSGVPSYNLTQSVIAKHHELENAQVCLSISHTKQTAVAVCIIS